MHINILVRKQKKQVFDLKEAVLDGKDSTKLHHVHKKGISMTYVSRAWSMTSSH